MDPTRGEIEQSKKLEEVLLEDLQKSDVSPEKERAVYMNNLAKEHNCELWRLLGATTEMLAKYGNIVSINKAREVLNKWGLTLVLDTEIVELVKKSIR